MYAIFTYGDNTHTGYLCLFVTLCLTKGKKLIYLVSFLDFTLNWQLRQGHSARIPKELNCCHVGFRILLFCCHGKCVCLTCMERRQFCYNWVLCSCRLAEQKTNDEWTERRAPDFTGWCNIPLLVGLSLKKRMHYFCYFKTRVWVYLTFK